MRKRLMILGLSWLAGLAGCGGSANDATAVVTEPAVAALGASLVPSDVASPTLEAELIPDFASDAATAAGFPADLLAPLR